MEAHKATKSGRHTNTISPRVHDDTACPYRADTFVGKDCVTYLATAESNSGVAGWPELEELAGGHGAIGETKPLYAGVNWTFKRVNTQLYWGT